MYSLYVVAAFGFFVPYFDRLVALLPTPPYTHIVSPRPNPKRTPFSFQIDLPNP